MQNPGSTDFTYELIVTARQIWHSGKVSFHQSFISQTEKKERLVRIAMQGKFKSATERGRETRRRRREGKIAENLWRFLQNGPHAFQDTHECHPLPSLGRPHLFFSLARGRTNGCATETTSDLIWWPRVCNATDGRTGRSIFSSGQSFSLFLFFFIPSRRFPSRSRSLSFSFFFAPPTKQLVGGWSARGRARGGMGCSRRARVRVAVEEENRRG